MSDPVTEEGLMKSLETLVPGTTAVKAVIRDRDWTYVRDRNTANTLGKQVAAEVQYRLSGGGCYVQRVYGFYRAPSHNEFVDQVEARPVSRPYPVKCE